MDLEDLVPVLCRAFREARLPGDAGHVYDRIESAVLVDQLAEKRVDRAFVGHRHRRRLRLSTRRHDAAGGCLLRLRKSLCAIEGHQRIESDDEPAATLELLG